MEIKSERGITLTALVVTIIIMTILAGTIVFGLTGTNGMFSTTRNVQRNYTQMEEETDAKVKKITDKWGNVINKTGIDPALSVD